MFIFRYIISKYFPFILYWFSYIDDVLEKYWLWLELIGKDYFVIFQLNDKDLIVLSLSLSQLKVKMFQKLITSDQN